MNRYALRDDQWERIKDLLPGKPGDVGVTAHDNRRFVEAVLYRYRTGFLARPAGAGRRAAARASHPPSDLAADALRVVVDMHG